MGLTSLFVSRRVVLLMGRFVRETLAAATRTQVLRVQPHIDRAPREAVKFNTIAMRHLKPEQCQDRQVSFMPGLPLDETKRPDPLFVLKTRDPQLACISLFCVF